MLDREKLRKALKDAADEYTSLGIAHMRKMKEMNQRGADLDELADEMERFTAEVGTVEDFMTDKVIELYGEDNKEYKVETPMAVEDAIVFAGAMEDLLNIPSLVCELIEKKLTEGKYEEVVRYVVERKKRPLSVNIS